MRALRPLSLTRVSRKKTFSVEEFKKLKEETETEHSLQSRCVRWFRETYPFPKYVLFAVPNAAKRSVVVGMMMKREGMLPGFPDLGLAHAKHGYHGLYIEMKRKGQKSRPNQILVQQALADQGYKVEKDVDSFESFVAIVTQYLN